MSDCDNENISGALILVINRDTLSNEFTNFMLYVKRFPLQNQTYPILYENCRILSVKRE